MNVVSTRASLKAEWSRIFWCRGMVVLTPSIVQLGQRPLHAGDGLGAGGLVDDQLADHRVVVGRNHVAGVDVRIEADAEPAGRDQPLDRARARGGSSSSGSSALMRHSIAAPRWPDVFLA